MIKLAPSILAADFNVLGEQIKTIEEAGVPYLHIDVMDGNYVSSISFGTPVIKSIRKNSKLVFDVHLMVIDPIRLLEGFAEAGADIITVHAEACVDLLATVLKIKEMGLKAGVSLNPETSLEELNHVIKEVDMVLLMGVEPGAGGQEFIPHTLNKIRELRKLANEASVEIDIEVDGGITTDNVMDVLEAGANVIVSGTSVFHGDILANIDSYKKEFDRYGKR
jgi:ribulose-phosphate 3-epimerase